MNCFKNLKKIKVGYIVAITLSFIVFESHTSAQTIDTLLNVNDPTQILIIEKSAATTVKVNGTAGDSSFGTVVNIEYPEESSVVSRQSTIIDEIGNFFGEGRWRGKKTHNVEKWDFFVDGVCLGLTKSVGDIPLGGPEWSKSIEVGWLSCLGYGYFHRNWGLTLGIGFDWRNYKTTLSDRRLVAGPGKELELSPYPADMRPKNSRLKVFSLQFPFLYRLDIPRTSLNLKAGVIFDFNTYASVKSIYTNNIDGKRIEEFSKSIAPRRFTLDFFGSISLSETVGLYIRYSPMKVMKSDYGINFRPLTLGVCIGI